MTTGTARVATKNRLSVAAGVRVVLLCIALVLGLRTMSVGGPAPADVGGAEAMFFAGGRTGSARLPGILQFDGAAVLPSGIARASSPTTAGQLAAGKFLVASRQLEDPNFMRTVVLLLHYDARGAMGLIINHSSSMMLAKILPQLEEVQGRTDLVYIGGPVALDGVTLLLRSRRALAGASLVFDDVYASGSLTTLSELTRLGKNGAFRAYLGHAGWAPGQLEAEVASGGWYVAPGEGKAIFDKPTSQVWPELIDRVAGSWARIERDSLLP